MSPHYDGLFIFSCRVKQIIEGQAYINFETSATLFTSLCRFPKA